MSVFIEFLILGAASGALIALAAQGLVLTYRGSGVVNFAHIAIGISGAYLFWELHVQHGQSWIFSFASGVLFSAVIGALIHLILMRRLRRASPLVRVVATLGVLVLLQGIAVQLYSTNVAVVPSALPTTPWHLGNGITITADRVYLFIIACAGTVVLWLIYKYTRFGFNTQAVAENQRAASTLGVSPDRVAAANWAIGCGIAAASFILLSSVTTIYVGQMTDLLLPVLAAALVGNFRSFGLTLAGGIGLGIIQTEVAYYSPSWGTAGFGLADTAPFIVILLLLVLRGRDLPLRDFFLQRQPGVGSGRVHPLVAIACAVVGVVVVFQGGGNWAAAWTTTFSIAIILLSIVLLTGYAGQISLAQFAIAGFGAWAGGRLVDVAHVPFLVALVVGIVAAAGLGTVMALPALRTRGVNLAILTLALGSGIEFMLFENSSYTGGVQGTILHDATHPSLNLFGWSIDGVAHPARYASVCVVALVLASWAVGNVRRGRSGRRLLAVRTNERAAAALGISVFSVKVYAFGLAAGLAGLGGVLLLFPSDTIDFSTISYSQSIILVALAVIGGVGYLLGPLLGSLLFVGAIGTQVTNQLFSASVAAWLQVFAGGVLILLILQEPDGMARAQYNQGAWIRARLRHLVEGSRERAGRARRGSVDQVKALGGIRERVAPKTLEVRAVSVRYGTVVAVDAVTLTARPGEILGLIGPNGAGKTSLIDVISGFAPAAGGAVLLDGRDITHWSPAKRARVGITRSFQSLELFDDMTVLDNLRTASDERDAWSYVTDLVHPVQAKLPQAVVTAVVEFGLAEVLEDRVEDLPYGQRRLLAVARAVAAQPSVLLLDECAAGLSEVESRELAVLVRRLADEWGMSIVLIEHDVNFVMSISDRIMVLDFGRKIADDAPEVIRADRHVIAAYLGESDEIVDTGSMG